jgi:hypothetical protein
MQRFQWRVLPQGMSNSPALFQKFISQAISPVQFQFPNADIIHYIDDILLDHPKEHQLNLIFNAFQLSLTASRLTCYSRKGPKKGLLLFLGTYY